MLWPTILSVGDWWLRAGGRRLARPAELHPVGGSVPARCSTIPRGFTLVEVMVATVCTLLLMAIVVQIFGILGSGVSGSRSVLEMNDRVRTVRLQLQRDLEGLTVRMAPPRRPEADEGYFEYLEGPMGVRGFAAGVGLPDPNNPGARLPDTTVGDLDDILMLTTRSPGDPFVGVHRSAVNSNPEAIRSQVAEVAWFVRGTTLYRRVLLVQPQIANAIPPVEGHYFRSDLSVHLEGDLTLKGGGGKVQAGGVSGPLRLVANSLGDLTKREHRYAHQPFAWPHDARCWSGVAGNDGNGTVASLETGLGLPTLAECSHQAWSFPIPADLPKYRFQVLKTAAGPVLMPRTNTAPSYANEGANWPQMRLDTASKRVEFDAWSNPLPWRQLNNGALGIYSDGARAAEDIVLTNVLSFDIKAWDPGAPIVSDGAGGLLMPGDQVPAYRQALNNVSANNPIRSYGAWVDLGYLAGFNYVAPAGFPKPEFGSTGDQRSGLRGYGFDPTTGTQDFPLLACVYDTSSTHYERDGLNQDPANDNLADEGTNGLDDDGKFGVDDAGEAETAPPYAAPLRGVQIRVRVFEPDSRQVKEITVVQQFLPE